MDRTQPVERRSRKLAGDEHAGHAALHCPWIERYAPSVAIVCRRAARSETRGNPTAAVTRADCRERCGDPERDHEPVGECSVHPDRVAEFAVRVRGRDCGEDREPECTAEQARCVHEPRGKACLVGRGARDRRDHHRDECHPHADCRQ